MTLHKTKIFDWKDDNLRFVSLGEKGKTVNRTTKGDRPSIYSVTSE